MLINIVSLINHDEEYKLAINGKLPMVFSVKENIFFIL